MKDHAQELLKLCGFEENELAGEKRRLMSVLERLDLGPEDMESAARRVRTHFDIGLMGVRKLLGIWLKELFDVVLAREEGRKLVYYGYPPLQATGMAVKAAAEDGIWVGCPEMVLCHTLGQIFDRLTPVLEAGEENGLPPGHALCALLQIKNGALAKGIIPVPDLAVATSYYCDMGAKADELMQQRYGHPIIYIDSSMDGAWGEWPDYDREKVFFLGAQIDKFFEAVKEHFGVRMSEEIWDRAKTISRHLYQSLTSLNQLLLADPLPISGADVELALHVPMSCTGHAMKAGPEAIDILCREVGKKVEQGIGVVEKGAPRVLTFSQHFSDPAATRMMEEAGLAVPATLSTVPPRRPPQPSPFKTIGEKRAEQAMWGGIYHSTYGWAKRFEDAVRVLKVDGVIYNYQFSCRPLALAATLVREWLEETVGVPTLALEMDFYDTRLFSVASLRTRIEAFAEMLKAKKMGAGTDEKEN